MRTLFACMIAISAGCPRPAAAQIPPASGCADCHFADPRSPRHDHLEAWDRSPHGRAQVTCEKCHGGDPHTFEPIPAHAGVLRASDAKSPVHRRNLPATCGVCHAGASVAFASSRHAELLRTGSPNGPTCSTCHGAVDGRVLSPNALGASCADCHGPGERAPRADRVRQVREDYEALAGVEQDLKLAQSLIKRVKDKRRRDALTEACQQAHVPLERAIDAGHQFVYTDLRTYLGLARTRMDDLLSRLANR